MLASLPASLLFLWVCLEFDFFQDDAYIFYRYVANSLNGDGLIFNIGERVEGFTSFGWTMWLLLWGKLGANYVLVSKISGIVFGILVLPVTLLLARRNLTDLKWSALVPVYLVGCNLSLAYWSQAGLETAAFVLLTALSLLFFIRRDHLLIASLTFAVMIRPEGMLLAVLFVIIEMVTDHRLARFTISCGATAFLLSLPMLIFRFAYYGNLLPNTFYAKSGFDLEQLRAGLEYSTRFAAHYPFLAAGLVLTPILWRRLTVEAKSLWLFSVMYVLYVILIGGDVLKVHRFFLPLLAPLAVLIVCCANLLTARLAVKWRYATLSGLVVIMLVASVLVPRDFIEHYEAMEKGLTHKFHHLAQNMKAADSTDFTVALSTIGAFSYELMGHRVIDMLGLTDSTIARHPEPPIQGLQTTWKERRYNSKYLLESEPDYIVFSTSKKPSSPAEKALMLYPEFLRAYHTVVFSYQPPDSGAGRTLVPVFKNTHAVKSPPSRSLDVIFVDKYIDGITRAYARDYAGSQRSLIDALHHGPTPPCPLVSYQIAQNMFRLGEPMQGNKLLNDILAADSFVYEAHADLYVYELSVGDPGKAATHRRWLGRLMPWNLGYFDTLATNVAKKYR